LQLHTSSGFYGFLQGQWKMKIAGAQGSSYLQYSIGIAQGISSFKPPKIFIPSLAIPVILDTDDDGVADEIDLCPDEKGLATAGGCPDSDGDTVPDKKDKCPDQPGLVQYDGCGIPDTDKDGVNDEEDKCPEVPGTIRYQGCAVPDTDKDGVNDEEDRCPELFGVIANGGCPEVKEEVQQKVNLAARFIQFKSSSDELLPVSKEALNEVATLMQNDPLLRLEIEGHTDNTGNNNQFLSEKRASRVRKYLLNKKIKPERLSSAGFGDKNPIADNETTEGRTMNRRVEMKFRY
jgi:OmpA-OmpF porin, OOP family